MPPPPLRLSEGTPPPSKPRAQWWRRLGPSALVGLVLVSPRVAAAAPTTTLIDDFEAANAERPWKFSNGSEFPGATGAVALGPGAKGEALELAYDFSGGGLYVAATREFSPGLDVSLLRFNVKTPPAAKLGLRVQDATGQWLQFDVPRPLAPIDPDAWLKVTVDLTTADSHWSGTNDGVLHLPVAAVSFTAQASSAHATERVSLDELEGLASLELAIDPDTVPLAKVPAGGGELFDGIGVEVHDIRDMVGLDEAMHAGFKWARTDLFWAWVETNPAVYDFSGFDDFFDALDARGMKPIFVLDFGNPLYCEGPPTTVDAQAAFAAYALAAAQHFAGRGAHFEIWNEPNIARFWPPAPDAPAFATLSKLAAQAVHAGDAGAVVITGGLSWFDFDYLAASIASGAATHADAVGVHPYRGTDPPETLAGHLVQGNLTIADNAGSNATRALWDTEWGYASSQFGAGDSTPARQRQAVFAARRLLAARLVGLPLAVWYDLRDDGTTPGLDEENFGLLTQMGSQKPAYLAVKMLYAATKSHSVAGVIDIAQPLLSGVVLDGAGDRTLALWATAPAHAVTIDVPRPSAAYDLLGNALPLDTSYSLLEALGPIYLTYAKSPIVAEGGAGNAQDDGGNGGADSLAAGEGGKAGTEPPADRSGAAGTGNAGAGASPVVMASGGQPGTAGGMPVAADLSRMEESLHGTCGCRVGDRSNHGALESCGVLALCAWARRRLRNQRHNASAGK